MYAHLLSAVLESDEPSTDGRGKLLALARTRREQMLTASRHAHPSAERSLAYDVNYDAALITLCAATGIDATSAAFGQPREERARLERALAAAGLDLAGTDRPQFPDSG